MTQDNQSTARTYTNKFFSGDAFKNFSALSSMLPFDLESVLETQRKNIEALTQVQQVAIENMQTISQYQAKWMSQMVEDNASLTKQILSEGSPEEKVSRQTDLVRESYERNLSNLTNLSELVSKGNRETGEIINKRVTASLTEFQAGMKNAAKRIFRI